MVEAARVELASSFSNETASYMRNLWEPFYTPVDSQFIWLKSLGGFSRAALKPWLPGSLNLFLQLRFSFQLLDALLQLLDARDNGFKGRNAGLVSNLLCAGLCLLVNLRFRS